MTTVKITRINNFICPACGEVMNQVIARDGVVKGWCPVAKKEINVVVTPVAAEETKSPKAAKPKSHLDSLKEQRDQLLKDVVSARGDGNLREDSAYQAAEEQLSVLESKIVQEEARIKQLERDH